MTEWISVNKSLPYAQDYEEDPPDVLITDGENIGVGWFDSGEGLRSYRWYSENQCMKEGNLYGHVEVTHWMPLPSPPEKS